MTTNNKAVASEKYKQQQAERFTEEVLGDEILSLMRDKENGEINRTILAQEVIKTATMTTIDAIESMWDSVVMGELEKTGATQIIDDKEKLAKVLTETKLDTRYIDMITGTSARIKPQTTAALEVLSNIIGEEVPSTPTGVPKTDEVVETRKKVTDFLSQVYKVDVDEIVKQIGITMEF